MPLYEYRCKSCDHQFEIQQAFSDDALTVCPECGGDLRKVFNAVGISFKGSGFYKNDSRSSSGSGSGSGSSSGSDSSDSSSASSGSAEGSSSGSASEGSASKAGATSSSGGD